MNSKYARLLKTLLNENKVMTSDELAVVLGVSSKTIRNYVSAINQECACIISSNKGYSLDRAAAEELLMEETDALPDTPEDRVSFVLMELLKTDKTNLVDLYDLSDRLAVSYETIKKDFINVKKILIQYDLYIQQNGEIVYIEGTERSKRELLRNMLAGEFSKNVLSLQTIDEIFPGMNARELSADIKEICRERHYFINEFSLLNLVLEILITVDRIRNNFSDATTLSISSNINAHEQRLAGKIIEEIEKRYQIGCSQSEYEELTRIIVGSIMKQEYEAISLDSLREICDEQTLSLVQSLLKEMDKWGVIDSNNENFIIKFTLHIKNLLMRLNNDYRLKNPLTSHIKLTCPMIFEYAVEISAMIRNYTGHIINEDEIAFLALHIGSIINEVNYLNDRIECILVVPEYYDFSIILADNLTKEFGDMINICKVEYRNKADTDKKYTLMITTEDAHDKDLADYTVLITPFLTRNDKSLIRSTLEKINLHKKKDYLKQCLESITDPVLFCKNKSFPGKEEIIRFISHEMVKAGCVTSSYQKNVLERENESSTAFGRIAVPHSLKMDARDTKVYVLLSDTPLPWGDTQVNMVLQFAIKKEERSVFFNVFDNLVSQLLDPSNLAKVLKSVSLDDFIENFINCISEN